MCIHSRHERTQTISFDKIFGTPSRWLTRSTSRNSQKNFSTCRQGSCRYRTYPTAPVEQLHITAHEVSAFILPLSTAETANSRLSDTTFGLPCSTNSDHLWSPHPAKTPPCTVLVPNFASLDTSNNSLAGPSKRQFC
jgi:hypothetical protein